MSTIFSNSVAFIDMEQEFWTGVLIKHGTRLCQRICTSIWHIHTIRHKNPTYSVASATTGADSVFMQSTMQRSYWLFKTCGSPLAKGQRKVMCSNLNVTSMMRWYFETSPTQWLKILTFYIGWMVEIVEWLMVENSSFLFWLNGWNGWYGWMVNGWKF